MAEPSIAPLICAAEAPGCVAAYNVAAPVTCGVAIDVPLYDAYPDLSTPFERTGTVDQMPERARQDQRWSRHSLRSSTWRSGRDGGHRDDVRARVARR